MNLLYSVTLAAALAASAHAQTFNCAAGQPCNPSLAETHLGDTNADSSAKGTVAITSKSGNAEAQGTAIGTEINPVLNQKGSITQQPTLTQTGGPQYSASGANADGSSKADATVGPIQVAPVGNSSIGKVGGDTKTGDNNLQNGSKSESAATSKSGDNNLNVKGGQGGKGGAGGTGGAGGQSAAKAAGGAATGGTGTGTSTATSAANYGAQTTGGNTLTGGATNLATGPTSMDASQRNSSQVNVDARALGMAQVTQNVLPGMTNSGNLISISGGCGPRMKVAYRDVYARHFGFFGDGKLVKVGESETAVREEGEEYQIDDLGNGLLVYHGSQVFAGMGKVGIATNKGVAGGGNQGTNFASLAGSVGASSASEAMEKGILILPCHFAVQVPQPAPAPIVTTNTDTAQITALQADVDRLTRAIEATQTAAAEKRAAGTQKRRKAPAKRNDCSSLDKQLHACIDAKNGGQTNGGLLIH